MKTTSSTLSAALGTSLRNKFLADLFFKARLKIFAAFFIVSCLVLIGGGLVTTYLLHGNIYTIAVTQNGKVVQDAFATFIFYFWIEKVVFIILLGVLIYLVTDFALRPIKKSAEIQKRFINIISHELRTPLAVMKSSTEIALRRPNALTRERAIEVLTSNLEELEQMNDTISFLLAFSLLRERGQILALKLVPLGELSAEVIALVRERYRESQVQMVLAAEAPDVVRGDVAALKGMLLNLIENAVLNTAPGGTVTVATRSANGNVFLTVSDTGQGIEPKDLPYIFEPFYRGTSKTSEDSRAHMGLGLSLVKEVAELHEAAIAVSSVLQRGSVFEISFPEAPAYPQN